MNLSVRNYIAAYTEGGTAQRPRVIDAERFRELTRIAARTNEQREVSTFVQGASPNAGYVFDASGSRAAAAFMGSTPPGVRGPISAVRASFARGIGDGACPAFKVDLFETKTVADLAEGF